MKLTTTNKQFVDEYSFGIYVWELSDGSVLGDGDGHIMNVFGTRNDRRAINAITQAAKSYGFPDGKPVFWQGKRPITDEEYEEQRMREKFGLVPDPLDYGAINDEIRAKQSGRN